MVLNGELRLVGMMIIKYPLHFNFLISQFLIQKVNIFASMNTWLHKYHYKLNNYFLNCKVILILQWLKKSFWLLLNEVYREDSGLGQALSGHLCFHHYYFFWYLGVLIKNCSFYLFIDQFQTFTVHKLISWEISLSV